ncbi:P1 family peptidase [Streptomyces sp. VRA16 Mangrove soil]|uniref:DmpA family aminopeptidase n=1 Tax=Streptomyces sp. VRA16 Mangrove soil TaxID=2817434 RepID=UPI001A9E3A90|nr:P1 family peptidase [Streptomyces sp. VRA16 Mangrove soil]MBO1334524.1 P1 family peptidase [Streptomyces sp. VRA16 Mangrove soil]
MTNRVPDRVPDRPRPRDLGIVPGVLPVGPANSLTDVPGVRVGHVTLDHDDAELPVRTGVTVVVPAAGSVFRDKPTAGLEVVNGFGKAAGLSQIAELGVLETPLALTNTLGVGTAFEGIVRHALAGHPEIGTTTGTVNPAVFECNDGWLNDIRGLHVRPHHVLDALEAASAGPVEEGAVGAGTGMVSFGWKAGIGSSSRLVDAGDGGGYTLGVLVLANFGLAEDLTVLGTPVGRVLTPRQAQEQAEFARGAGSCVVLVATDAPADARQLRRIAKRGTVGLARTGGIVQHGSGEYALAWSTTQRTPHTPTRPTRAAFALAENGPLMDLLFRATAEATEEAVLAALFAARPVTGVRGHHAPALPTDRVAGLVRASALSGDQGE